MTMVKCGRCRKPWVQKDGYRCCQKCRDSRREYMRNHGPWDPNRPSRNTPRISLKAISLTPRQARIEDELFGHIQPAVSR